MASPSQSFTKDELNRKIASLRKEAVEFERLVREGRNDLEGTTLEDGEEAGNGSERIRRAIALARKLPNFDNSLQKLSQAKEAWIQLQSESKLIRDKVDMCLRNPIFDNVDEYSKNDEDRGETQIIFSDSGMVLDPKIQAQILLADDNAEDTADEIAAKCTTALEDIRKLDIEFLTFADDSKTTGR